MTLFKYQAPYKGGGECGILRNARACSGPALLISSLAWAARNGVPFHQVLPTLTDSGDIKKDPSVFTRGGRWNNALWTAAADLRGGAPLSKALRARFGHTLPPYFLTAAEQAEKDGTLKETLAGFAKRAAFFEELKAFRKTACWGPLAELGFILMFSWTFFCFVLPKYAKICGELLPFTSFNSGLELALKFRRGGLDYLSAFLCGFVFAGVFYIMFRSLRYFLAVCAREIIVRIPVLRRYVIDSAMIGLCAAFGGYLSSGRDVLDAAKFCRASSGDFWLRRRLDVFIRAVSDGGDWLKAWAVLTKDQPLASWTVANAAAAGNAAAGFDTMAEWLYFKVSRASRVNTILLFVGIILLSACAASFIVFSTFSALADILRAAAG